MVESLEYDSVFKEDKGSLHPGRFKANTSGIVFKNSKTGKLDSIAGNEIVNAAWQRLAAAPGLRLSTKNGSFFRFGGFGESDFDKFHKFFSEYYSVNLRERDFCLKGWNWGVANFQGSVLNFDVDKTPAFEVPLTNVSHCTSAKNEVTLEFHTDEGAVSLMELRFHIPNPQDASNDDPVQNFVDSVMAKADIIQATGDAIVTFSELHCLTPRGRYDIKLFPSFIQLHGKTFDYKIPLTTVLRLFRLPQKDGRQVYFVMSLDPPIKQGQTRYHFLILNFNKDDVTRLELNVQDDSKEKFSGLDRVLEGPTIDLIGKVMKALVQRKITLPSDNFCGKHQMPVITCSYKSSSGVLYPLDRGFIFVHKPPIHVRNEEIAAINFARGGSSTRSFDFEVELKSGVTHTFSSIEKEEYARLFDFVQSKKLRVKNTGAPAKETVDDDDMMDSDDEDDQDAYLHRVKQEGREREDSDESDESFNPDAGSGGSDVAEEFDSDASESSDQSDASDGTPKKKKKEKKEKEKKKEKKVKTDKVHKEKKKSKKDVDPNKPKKPMTAYFLWANENRDRVKEKYPELKGVTEVAKKLGELWKEVSDKSKWEKEAIRLKDTYQKDMAEYSSTAASSSGQQQKSSKAKETKTKKKSKEASPQKGSFKSREFLSDSSSDEEDKKKSKKKKKDSSDDEDDSGDSD